MLVYTLLRFFCVCVAGFVGDAVVRAGGGCFGLAIKDYGAVHAYTSLVTALRAWRTWDPVNWKGKACKPVHAISWVAKSNIPYPPCFVLL